MSMIVFYHANCPDGFGAAWAFRTLWDRKGQRSISYIPAEHDDQQAIIDACKEKDVIGVFFLDFCPKIETLQKILGLSSYLKVRIIDHHETALQVRGEYDEKSKLLDPHRPVEWKLDMSRSGCVLTWDHLSGEEQAVPALLYYVQDRDLWQWKLLGSHEVNLGLSLVPRTFEAWDLARENIGGLLADGRVLRRSMQTEMDNVIKTTLRTITIAVPGSTLDIPFVNTSVHTSDTVNRYLETHPEVKVAGYYYDTPNGRRFGLRSRSAEEFDVEVVARYNGGGGHKTAAGFVAHHS